MEGVDPKGSNWLSILKQPFLKAKAMFDPTSRALKYTIKSLKYKFHRIGFTSWYKGFEANSNFFTNKRYEFSINFL